MTEDEKRMAIIVIAGICCIQAVHAYRIRNLSKALLESHTLLITHLEDEFQEDVDEAFDHIVEGYDDGY